MKTLLSGTNCGQVDASWLTVTVVDCVVESPILFVTTAETV
jgi:hypothetical protein